MQRIEWIKHLLNNTSMDNETKLKELANEIAEPLCDTVDCESCPFTETCRAGHIGSLDWLA